MLHDQHTDRTLLSTRAHNRLVRYRGYRILHRGGRTAYGATVGLPANVRRTRAGDTVASRYTRDARQQVRVWGNTWREDGRAWHDTARHASHDVRENTDRGGPGPFPSRRLPTTGTSTVTSRPVTPARPASPGRPAGPPAPAGRTAQATGAPSTTTPPAQPSHPDGPGRRARPDLHQAVLPGGGSARGQARQEARARMQELMRRTAPEAERLRQQRARRRNKGGEQE